MVYKRCQLKAIARSIQVDVDDADGDGDCLPLGLLLNGLSWRRKRICPRQTRGPVPVGSLLHIVVVVVVIVARCHLFSGVSEAQAVGVQLLKLTCFLPIVLFCCCCCCCFGLMALQPLVALATCCIRQTPPAPQSQSEVHVYDTLINVLRHQLAVDWVSLSQLEFQPELLDLCWSRLGQSQSEQAAKKAINVVRYDSNKSGNTLRTEL